MAGQHSSLADSQANSLLNSPPQALRGVRHDDSSSVSTPKSSVHATHAESLKRREEKRRGEEWRGRIYSREVARALRVVT